MLFHITRPVFIMPILFAIAAAVSAVVYPSILKIAKEKNLVDNPNARKLHKEPVPVVGGLVVFFGIVVALCFFKTTVNYINLFSTLCAMMVMLYLGSIDDILDTKPWKKFLIEILVCILIIYGTRNLMSNFQGLFGISILKSQFAIPLTVFGMVGIINSINLIDGVDGLSSGMSIFIFGCLSLFLFLAHEFSGCALAVICSGALLPFFIHNVFGKESKMYIGDGGALMIGVAIAYLILQILKGRGIPYTGNFPDFDRMSMISMCLAVVSVPVSDTLRVMTERLLRGVSPFYADKTHLHHCLLKRGWSHIRVSMTEIALDALVVAVWLASWLLGWGVGLQFGIVVALGFGITFTLSRINKGKTI